MEDTYYVKKVANLMRLRWLHAQFQSLVSDNLSVQPLIDNDKNELLTWDRDVI